MNRRIQSLFRKNVGILLVVILVFALFSLRFPDSTVKTKSHRKIGELYQKFEFQQPIFKIFTTTEAPPQQEVVHVSFLKIHKTGSTTAQNMFLRFGWSRNLTFVLPPEKNAFGYPNIISLKESLHANNTVLPPAGKHFDLLCHHVIYNRDAFRQFLPNDTVYIGILREPFEQFKSTLNYLRPSYVFKLRSPQNVLPGSTYLQNPAKYEPKKTPAHSFTNNRMAVEFGFSDDVIMKGLEGKALDYIKRLDEDFSLVIIAEYFEESILLMKRILNWSHKDIIYLDKNVAMKKNESSFVGPFDRQGYKRWAKVDYALYNHFFRKLREQIRAEGYDFDDELLHFQEIRKMAGEFCKQKPFRKDAILKVHRSKWSPEFEISYEDCLLLRKGEIDFTQTIRRRQYGVTS